MPTVDEGQKGPEVSGNPAPSPTEIKPVHSLILDAGPLIKNDPPVSTLLAQAQELYTIPSVISEIRDVATRNRVETTLLPFLKLRSPRSASIKFVTDFARRTGDLEVLSKPDIHLMALAYELECELNGGDWRLRNSPDQKELNGKSPAALEKEKAANAESSVDHTPDAQQPEILEENTSQETASELAQPVVEQETVTQALESMSLEQSATPTVDFVPGSTDKENAAATPEVNEEEDDDEDGWITPSNLKKHQVKDQQSSPEQPTQRVLKAALLTSDFAMQNVLLRINLNLVSPSLSRITRVKTWVLRCHGCFKITRDTSKQFCPSCGQPTLTRVSCATDQSGRFQIFLKKNFQWNNRGNVYSVPKPVHGTPTGKARGPGGGKNGWGRELIFAEDQKEYERKSKELQKAKTRDLMDDDYLPSILTGERQSGPGRIRVGAGRNVNSRKRI